MAHQYAGLASGFIRTVADWEISSWESCDTFWCAYAVNQPLWDGSLRTLRDCKLQVGLNTPNVQMVQMRPHGNGSLPHRYEDGFCVYCAESKELNRPSYGILLYDTMILVYHVNGFFQARNGGYNTITTSRRLNQFGPKGWFFFHHKKELGGRCGDRTVWPLDGQNIQVSVEAAENFLQSITTKV